MRLFTFCLSLFLFCLVSACRPAAAPVSISNKPVSINDVPQTNVPLPPLKNVENLGWQTFDGTNLAIGQMQTLGELKGKTVVLDFWATYCPPCLEEIPHLVALQEQHKDLQIIGLHVGGEEDRPKVPEFAKKLKINYTLASPDEALTAALLAGETAIPQTFVFNRQGKLIEKFTGYDESVKNGLEMAITESLNNSR